MAPHLPDSLKTYYMGKSKLTAVCSHYASIGNVGAPPIYIYIYFCKTGGNRPDGLNEPVTQMTEMLNNI